MGKYVIFHCCTDSFIRLLYWDTIKKPDIALDMVVVNDETYTLSSCRPSVGCLFSLRQTRRRRSQSEEMHFRKRKMKMAKLLVKNCRAAILSCRSLLRRRRRRCEAFRLQHFATAAASTLLFYLSFVSRCIYLTFTFRIHIVFCRLLLLLAS